MLIKLSKCFHGSMKALTVFFLNKSLNVNIEFVHLFLKNFHFRLHAAVVVL